MEQRNIVVIGSSNTDLVVKTARIPEHGETVTGGTFMMTAGGKGANQAVAVARLGGHVGFVAKVGDDLFGRQAISQYIKEGLDVSYVRRDTQCPSGVALITVDQNGENCIAVAPGANARLNKEDIDAAKRLIFAAHYILMQLETPMEIIQYVADQAYAKGIKVILNPAPMAPLSDELLRKLYLITPNKTETRQLTGIQVETLEDADAAADVLLAKGVQNVVITLGSQGSFVKGSVPAELVPAHNVPALDTTGAGDTFSGALCVALSEDKNLAQAVRFATQASAISVTRMGAQASMPYRRELK